MPFGNITAQTKVFEPRTAGVYSLTGLTFDQPRNEFRIRGGSQSKTGAVTAGIQRVLEKDVTVAGAINRVSCSVSLSLTLPANAGFTAAEIDSMAADISEFMSAATVSRLLQGES